jgi:O-antigen/teichoic acid export membrane protein
MFIIFGKHLLYLLGKEYINGYNVLIILSLCSLIEAMSGVFQVYTDAKGRSDLNLISYIIYNISTIYFIALFTNLYSKEGTALGYLFGIVVLSIMRFIFYFKISK